MTDGRKEGGRKESGRERRKGFGVTDRARGRTR